MDIHFTPEEQAFRSEVRAFLAHNLPADIADKVRLGRRLAKDDHQRWHKILNRQGWYAVNWPVEYGGTGWSVVQKHIFDEECAAAGAPVRWRSVSTWWRRSSSSLAPRPRRIITCRGFCPARTGGARAIPNPVPVPTWLA